MKSIILLAAIALCLGLASANSYKVYKLVTEEGSFRVLNNGTQACDDLRVIINENKKIKEAAKSQGTLEINDEDLGSALVSSLSLKDMREYTNIDLSSEASKVTKCTKASRRHRLRSLKKRRAQTKVFDEGFLSTFKNKYLTVNEKVENSKENGQEQFFDTAPQVVEHAWLPKDDKKRPKVDDIVTELGLSKASLAIKAAKLYYRFSGNLPLKTIIEGNKRFLGKNLYKAVPGALEAAYWFKLDHKPEKMKDPIDIHHEFLELCLDGGVRLLVDRGSRESPPGIFNTRVRFIKLDTNGGDCSLNSDTWIDGELKDLKYTDKNFKVRDAKTVSGVSAENIINYAIKYIETFPVYNTLANCQHFATNTYNLLTASTLDYDSFEIMENHSDLSGKEPKLPFGVNLERTGRRLRRLNKRRNRRNSKRRNAYRRRA